MKSRSARPYLGLSVLILFTFGCLLFSPPPMEPVPITQQAINTETIPTEPTDAPAAIKLPSGILTEKNGVLILYDRNGAAILQMEVPGLAYVDPNNLHIAGAVPTGGTNLPLVYYSFEQDNSILFSNYGQITSLRSVPFFSGMAGADGSPFIAYTTAEFADTSLIGNLYIISTQAVSTVPVLSDNDPQGWAVVALGLDLEADQPAGIWYSKRPWGIGGDIVFEPRRTLSYLDLRSGAAYQYLGADANPSALSADRQWVAYTNDTSVEAGVGAMSIRNMSTGANISYPLLSAVDQRGAGVASFSPNNQYLAWMEGSGWQMAEVPNFHSVVRVGNLNGNIIAEFADTALLPASGLSMVQRVEPVGWFDDNTLVIMARGEYWGDAALLVVDLPSQSVRLLTQSAFVAFTYP